MMADTPRRRSTDVTWNGEVLPALIGVAALVTALAIFCLLGFVGVLVLVVLAAVVICEWINDTLKAVSRWKPSKH